jgi:hypothetical protein
VRFDSYRYQFSSHSKAESLHEAALQSFAPTDERLADTSRRVSVGALCLTTVEFALDSRDEAAREERQASVLR